MKNDFIDEKSYSTLIEVADSLEINLNFDLNVLNNVIAVQDNELKQNSLVSKFLHITRYSVEEIDELKGREVKQLIIDINNYIEEINTLHNEYLANIEQLKADETKQLNDMLLTQLKAIQTDYISNYNLIDYTIKIELNKSIFSYKIVGTKLENDNSASRKNEFTFDINKLPCSIDKIKYFRYKDIKFVIEEGQARNIDNNEIYNTKVDLYKTGGHKDGIGVNFYREVKIINKDMEQLKFKD